MARAVAVVVVGATAATMPIARSIWASADAAAAAVAAAAVVMAAATVVAAAGREQRRPWRRR